MCVSRSAAVRRFHMFYKYLSIFGVKVIRFLKVNILTCSDNVGEECVEWEIPLVDVAEGTAAVGKERGSAGKRGSGDVCVSTCVSVCVF